MNQFIKDKIRVTFSEILKDNMERTFSELPYVYYKECDGYKKAEELPDIKSEWKQFGRNDRVMGNDKHFWFYTHLLTPNVASNEAVELEVRTGAEVCLVDMTNPQGLVYLNGEAVQGLDINHTRVRLEPNTEYDIIIYFYTGLTGFKSEFNVDVIIKNTDIEKLYYDIKVPYDAAMCFDKDDYNHITILKYLERACNIIDARVLMSEDFINSIKMADEFLQEEFYKKECGKVNAVVNYVGHTHIDVAWLWTLDQTKEKVQRSFSTVLKLMDEYPEYVFMSSQPQLYKYLKQEDSVLYEKVKQRVKEGRWEVEGAMWLEADCNLSSGESLVRQILFGKRFMRDEFGVESKVLWLPDVFGYSAALPQILQKSGVNKFVTSKISWNETNRVPYDSFMWKGIDGTEIFTYFMTARNNSMIGKGDDFQATYVGMVTPDMHLGTWNNYQQKEYSNETIVTFGYGDGGGGSTPEMVETFRRLKCGLPGMPKAEMSFAADFLDKVEDNFNKNCEIMGRVPKWIGELYLEMHRGTYTSMAKNKKNNRECEFLCQTCEAVSVTDGLLLNGIYPSDELNTAWETLLLNQFHDIIPGSSIYEVYEESDRQYAKVRNDIGSLKDGSLERLAANTDKDGIFVYNPNSFEVSGYARVDDDLVYVENIPPMGWKVTDAAKTDDICVSGKKIESRYYTILFNDNMEIVSIYDKESQREVISKDGAVNRLVMYEDYPRDFDNWEITDYYKQKAYPIGGLEDVKIISGAGFGGFEIKRKYNNSTICQKIVAYDKSRRIDIINDIDWHEHHKIMKAEFDVDVLSDRATYDIQFGNVERPTHRNTSWDAAKFEVCAHKWCDLSEDNYGVSILNNCKYGYSVYENEMTLTLIKCGTYPNPEADQGKHSFTYSIYPHTGDFRQGGTVQEAYILNRPLETIKTNGGGNLPSEYSLVQCDAENIIIETVKQAEDGDGIIVRLFDVWNRKSMPKIKFGFSAKKIELCDMMENPIETIGSGDEVSINVANYEIVTMKLSK